MADAGLTRGGFYSYFKSKSELYAEVLDCFFTDPNWKARWEGVAIDLNSRSVAPQIVSAYLSRGDSVRKNKGKGFNLLLTSARQGEPHAQYAVGLCYEKGQGVGVGLEITVAGERVGEFFWDARTHALVALTRALQSCGTDPLADNTAALDEAEAIDLKIADTASELIDLYARVRDHCATHCIDEVATARLPFSSAQANRCECRAPSPDFRRRFSAPPRGWVERGYNVQRSFGDATWGHFAAHEEPERSGSPRRS